MSVLGPHAGFIVAAYAVAALILIGLVLWAVLDERRQKRLARELEARAPRLARRRGDA